MLAYLDCLDYVWPTEYDVKTRNDDYHTEMMSFEVKNHINLLLRLKTPKVQCSNWGLLMLRYTPSNHHIPQQLRSQIQPPLHDLYPAAPHQHTFV